MARVVVFLMLVVLFILTGCHRVRTESRVLPVPRLSQGTVELRVGYVVNPRLPQMSPQQLKVLLLSAQKAAQDHFGIDLKFSAITEVPIATLFDTIPPKIQKELSKHIFDFKSGKGDQERLAQAFGKGLKDDVEPLASMISYARPYIGELPEQSYEAFGKALARVQLERIERLKAVQALDGSPSIDSKPYNEYLMWVALGYADLPFEVILTNQIIASVEDLLPSVHSAIRGGYANGITTYSRSSRFGTVSIWSIFAFASDDPFIVEFRNGERYSLEEAARLAGIGMTHELGHQLFHLSHPYDNPACIMDPVPMFSFRSWVDNLSAKDCRLGSSPAMQPGAYKFLY